MTNNDEDRVQEAFEESNRLFKAGDFVGALAAYDQSLELRPDDYAILNNRGNALSELGRYGEALAAYDRSLELRADDPTMLNNRGVALRGLGRHEEALVAHDRSLELHPDDPATLNNRGNALIDLGRYGEGLAAYDRSLGLRADDPTTLTNRGVALRGTGRYEEALVAHDRSLELRPDDPNALNNRGVALGDLRRYRQAIGSYKKAIRAFERIGATAAIPYANMGEAQYQLRWFHRLHLWRAVKSFRRALGIDGERPHARNGLGVCLLALGHPADAATEFSRAVERAPDELDPRYNYAVACQRDGRRDRAKSELARILDEDPTFEPARRALDKLTAEPIRPDVWQAWTQGSVLRRALGIALLGSLALLVVLPIVYLLFPSLDSPTLPWQYYVAALAVVAGALVLPAVRQFRAFGVELEPQPPRSAEAQLEPLLR